VLQTPSRGSRRVSANTGIERPRMTAFLKVGDLVKYTFRTFDGNKLRPGLIIGRATVQAEDGAIVWWVQGLDGMFYKIHNDYLRLLKKVNN
jgi:hypothetical protein